MAPDVDFEGIGRRVAAEELHVPDTTQERIAELPRDEHRRGVARRQCRLASCTIEVQQLACASARCAADAVGRCEQLPEAEDSGALP